MGGSGGVHHGFRTVYALFGKGDFRDFSLVVFRAARKFVIPPALLKYTAQPPQPGKAGTPTVRVFFCGLPPHTPAYQDMTAPKNLYGMTIHGLLVYEG